MNQNELFHLLALLQVEGVGDIMAKKLLNAFGSAAAVFEAKPNQLRTVDGIGDVLVRKLKDKSIFEKATAEIQFIEHEGVRVLYFTDEAYPERLKHCIDGQITAYGTEFCKKLLEDLSFYNPIIVSGLAYGVDIVAHQTAMELQLQTVGVLAHGLNQIYPKSHKKFVAKMEQNGGFLTEFWSSSSPEKENFVKRNRIVAGMSEATIVIESAEKGGSLITANLANDYNRDVFAVPGRTTDKYSQGCNELIKTQRAQLITSAADLIYSLNWQLEEEKPKTIQKQLFVSLDAEEQKIYDFLLQNGKQLLDIIALECEYPIFRVSSTLINMELKGVVRPLPGKLFEAI